MPFEYKTDKKLSGSIWPITFLPEPVFSIDFIKALRKLGVSNIDEYPVLIRDGRVPSVYENHYKVLNIIGRTACADLKISKYDRIGEKSYVFDTLVIQSDKIGNENLFRLGESPTVIIVTGKIATSLKHVGFKDVYFELIPVS